MGDAFVKEISLGMTEREKERKNRKSDQERERDNVSE